MKKKLFGNIKNFLKKSDQEKIKAYPRAYSDKELENLINKLGEMSPNNPGLAPAYFSKANLGLIELQGRQNGRIAYMSLFVAISALAVSFYGLRLTKIQVDYAQIQSIPTQINQARIKSQALEDCKQSPESKESGLYYVSTGKSTPCSEVLKTYK